jgi:MFS family permease
VVDANEHSGFVYTSAQLPASTPYFARQSHRPMPISATTRPLILVLTVLVLTHAAHTGSRLQILGVTPAINGTLMALFGAVPMMISIAAGRLVDRIGFYRPMLIGSALVLTATLLLFALPTLTTLYIAAMILGGGFTLFQIATQNAVGHIGRPEDRAVNFSWLALAFSISNLAAPLIAGIGIDTIGHRAVFLLFAFGPAVPFLALALGKLILPVHTPMPNTGAPRRLLDLVQTERLRNVYTVTALTSVAWDLFMFVIPVYGSSIGLSATLIGLIIGAFALASFLVRLAIPFVAKRLPPWKMLISTLIIAALVFVIFPFAKTVPPLMALAFILGLGLGSGQPMILTLLHTNAPPGRAGEVLGLRQTIINAAQTGVPLLFGAAGTAVGIGPVFWGLGLSLLWGSWHIRGELKPRGD